MLAATFDEQTRAAARAVQTGQAPVTTWEQKHALHKEKRELRGRADAKALLEAVSGNLSGATASV